MREQPSTDWAHAGGSERRKIVAAVVGVAVLAGVVGLVTYALILRPTTHPVETTQSPDHAWELRVYYVAPLDLLSHSDTGPILRFDLVSAGTSAAGDTRTIFWERAYDYESNLPTARTRWLDEHRVQIKDEQGHRHQFDVRSAPSVRAPSVRNSDPLRLPAAFLFALTTLIAGLILVYAISTFLLKRAPQRHPVQPG